MPDIPDASCRGVLEDYPNAHVQFETLMEQWAGQRAITKPQKIILGLKPGKGKDQPHVPSACKCPNLLLCFKKFLALIINKMLPMDSSRQSVIGVCPI